MNLKSLNKEKQVALERLKDFLNSDKKVFILSGRAGSGKTLLISHLINYIERETKYDYLLLAATGKAANILRHKTQREANTIHRTLFVVNKEILTEENKYVFTLKKHQPAKKETIIIIDEASLIGSGKPLRRKSYKNDNSLSSQMNNLLNSKNKNKEEEKEVEVLSFGSGNLLKDIFDFSNIFYDGEKNIRTKIIFVGDQYQLPPINQKFSPALSQDRINQLFGHKPMFFKLNDVKRYDHNSGIYKISSKLVNLIDTDKKIFSFNDFENFSDLQIYPKNSFEDFFQTYISKIKDNGVHYSVIIVHRNDSVININKKARKQIFGNKLSEKKEYQEEKIITKRFLFFRWKKKTIETKTKIIDVSDKKLLVPGEPVMVYANNYKYNLMNGDVGTVIDVLKDDIRVKAYLTHIWKFYFNSK
jgi:ATP-dependent exoDNAse (exonuclease V) alpha subunit